MSDRDTLKKIGQKLEIKLEEGDYPGYELDHFDRVFELSLYDCKITDLNLIIALLKNLQHLDKLVLNENQILDLSPLIELRSLTILEIDSNGISDISKLKELKNLKELHLNDNLIEDISSLRELTNLDLLGLHNNPIEKLPSWITDFQMDIVWSGPDTWAGGAINFYDNPLKSPPPEIVKQGKEAIKNYFEQLEKQGKDTIHEAKLMLVGEPGSGKTTLLNKLFDKNFPVPNKKQKSTLGIEVRPNWQFSVDKKTDFKAHIWDFGGQQIQYMLHQFFLTSNCLYVLMAEKRRELANYDYWLNIINILGEKSPVVTLFNEINIDSVTSFIYDEKKYTGLFPELNLQKLDVNLGDISDGRFNVLLNTIKKKLGDLEHVEKEVPAKWIDVRKDLEKRRQKKHITIDEYFDICRKFEINKEDDQLLILRYFHLLGIVLHFSEDENLSDTLFLDPNWTVDAVYSVLANKELEKSSGVFTKADVDKIWSAKGYEFKERAKLLQLMLKDNFDLCYKLLGPGNKYIIPLLLSKIKPEFKWDKKDNLQFRFQYPFRPKGIVSRLIVRMNEYIDKGNVWNEGVIFKKNGAKAQVIEQKTAREGLKIIEILVKGTITSRKDLLTLIREEIKRIQNSSFPHLPYAEMVPCTCKDCAKAATPYFFDYGHIETYLQKGKTEIDCRKSTEDVSIAELVGSVFNIEELESRYKEMTDECKIKSDFKPHIHMQQEQKQQQKQKQEVSQEVKVEVKNIQGLFKNLKEDILGEVELEIEDPKEKQRIKNELQKTEKAFSELEKAVSEGKKELDSGTKNRLVEFIENLADKDSRINKALKFVSGLFGLPSVPSFLLGKKKD